MKPVAVTDDIKWIGVHDAGLAYFEKVLPTPWGTTYNAYLIKAPLPTLVEGVRAAFREEYLEKLRTEINPLDIKYIILNHTEADHSGSLPWVADACPNAHIITSKAASRHIRSLFDLDRDVMGVQDGDVLDLGDRELRFIMAPHLHWPDTMFTYAEADRVLFTCDAFGTHFCDSRAVFDDETALDEEKYHYYYRHIMRPFKDKVLDAVRKIEPLAVDVIANGHGPVLRRDPWEYVERYRRWSEDDEPEEKRPAAVVFYAGDAGNAALAADQVARGMTAHGVEPVLFDAAATRLEVAEPGLRRARGVIVIVPEVMGGEWAVAHDIMDALGRAGIKGKKAATFGEYGGSGATVEKMAARLKSLGAELVVPELGLEFSPDEDTFQRYRDFGKTMAAAILA